MDDLNERASVVLSQLIEQYIDTGAPVGSGAIVKSSRLSCSPATVRNVMAELEAMGLLASPHTSAGRVPTAAGYRLFINSLLQVNPEQCVNAAQIKEMLAEPADPKTMLQQVSKALSQFTSFAGVVSMPGSDVACFRQIEFLTLSGNRVLAILVTTDGNVENKVLALDRAYSDSDLTRAANYFNEAFAQRSMHEVRGELLRNLQQDRDTMHEAMRTAIDMAQGLMAEDDDKDKVVLSGEGNLMGLPEFAQTEQMKALLDTFQTKQVLLDLVSRSMQSDGIQIFIGEESGHEALEACSVVTMPYEKDGQRVGVLGVIGPTRMAYDQVVSVVDVTSKLLSSALSR